MICNIATGSRVVITQSPVLKAASSRRSAWREGSRSRPSCGPGGFWSGSRPSRTNKVRRCAIELRQSFALLPRRSDPWIWISKPSESSVKKFICGRSAPTAALPVKGPAKNELRRTIVFSSHPSEPMVDERRLPDTSPGNDGNDIYMLVCPRIIQESDILLSTKNIASCNGQSGYGNFLRSQSCWRLASYGQANLLAGICPKL